MKKLPLFCLLLIGIASFCFMADDLTRFGTNQDEFKERIIQLAANQEFPGFKFYYSQQMKKACMAIPVAEQASAARSIGKMVKAFVMGTNFKADYEKSLMSQLRNVDRNSPEIKEKYEDSYRSNLESAESLIKIPGMSEQIFQIQQSSLDNFQKGLQDIENKDVTNASLDDIQQLNSLKNLYKRQIALAQNILKIKPLLKSNPAEFTKQYAKALADSEIQSNLEQDKEENTRIMAEIQAKKNYKANIKAQLQQFLDESVDVDFNAKIIKQSNGFEEFENETYRDKPRVWKQCFRIGKPATMAFREIAQEWLREL
ncbi:hypothetical protein [Emticicia sp. 17c]|uniref:hypothetical protein n=1 Tax=Emticicia sp. 17c TaxID=3127704 RepID=UPI00301E162D